MILKAPKFGPTNAGITACVNLKNTLGVQRNLASITFLQCAAKTDISTMTDDKLAAIAMGEHIIVV